MMPLLAAKHFLSKEPAQELRQHHHVIIKYKPPALSTPEAEMKF